MRQTTWLLSASALLLAFAAPHANASVLFADGFEASWSGDYAPGWENTTYRHGVAPVAQMMQQSSTAHSGSYGLRLIVDANPDSLFWVAVNPNSIPTAALDKQYNPYFSAWYYEENKASVAGQIFAVPDTPIADNDDWTDIQFGGRRNDSGANFSFIAASMNLPSAWVDTGVARTGGWHQIMMQLLDSDGKIHFTLDGVEVGATTRADYTNLGTVGLYTMFNTAVLGAGVDQYTLWDDVRVGSDVPEPATLALAGIALAGLAASRRRSRK